MSRLTIAVKGLVGGIHQLAGPVEVENRTRLSQ
jgi:hypothetical protein